jgi:hypothetical protein
MKNTRNFLMIFALSFATYAAQAQVAIGLKGGANFADTRINGVTASLLPDLSAYPGWVAGINAEFPITGGLSFNPEFNFNQKGFVASAAFLTDFLGISEIDAPVGLTFKTRMDHIELPLIMKYSFKNEGPLNTYIFAGPSVGYMVNDEIRPVASFIFDINLPKLPIPDNLLNKWEVGAVIGAGAQVKVSNHGKIFGDIRYQHGFTNVLNNPIVDIDINNRGIQLAAGYAYIF